MKIIKRSWIAAPVAVLSASPCWALAAAHASSAAALHVPTLVTGLSSGLSTLFLWLFGG